MPTAGTSILDSDLELARRKRLLAGLILFCVVVLLSLGTTALVGGHLALAVVDYTAALFFIGVTIYLIRSGSVVLSAAIGLTGLGGLFLYLLVDGGVGYTGFVWIFTYPLLTVYLLGGLRGGIMAGVVIGVFVGLRFGAPHTLGSGHPYSGDFMIRLLASLGVIGFVSIYMDRARREAQQVIEKKNELLHNLSRLDGLTGVYNRRHFDEELERQWAHANRLGAPLSLLMIDVDHFKKYNDRYGHQAGDDALVTTATVLSDQACRKIDITARYGGEEFAVILPATDPGGAVHVCRRILRQLADQKIEHADGIQGRLTVSIGLACYNARHEFDSGQSLLKAADEALYEAKQSGRNTFRPE